VFDASTTVLAQSEGALSERPFPLLLRAVLAEGRTVALELRRNQLEKRLTFEDGWPVGCRSNLLHETLGRHLVDRGRLTEAQCHEALAISARDGEPLGEVLVKRGWLSPFDLYKSMQQSTARKVIDCFTWTDAKYRFVGAPPSAETPLRMNPAQLILAGATTVLPFEVVAQGLTFFDGQRFARVPVVPEECADLKLSSRDQRVLTLLGKRPTFEELVATSKLPSEEVLRRLYAFGLLGMVAFADDVAEAAPVSESGAVLLKPAPAPVAPEAAEPTVHPEPDDAPPDAELEARRNVVMDAFLKHRTQDAFELLGLTTKATVPEIRRAYFAFSEKFRPADFTGPLASVVDKVEELAIAGARAVAALTDHEGRTLAIERHLRKKRESKERRDVGDAFKIKTTLLDAGEQYREGAALMKDGSWDAAVRSLEYACDIDSTRARYRADLGWARFHWQPASPDKALADLAKALRIDPACDLAHFYEGRIHERSGELAKAEESYRKAIKSKPDERRYTDALKDIVLARKRAR